MLLFELCTEYDDGDNARSPFRFSWPIAGWMTLSVELCGHWAKGGRQHGQGLVVSLLVKYEDLLSDKAVRRH